MPHKTASALIGAGAFALGLAVLVPTAIAPALMKAPAEIDLETHSRSEAQKLNPTTGELETVTVDLTRKVGTHALDEDTFAGTEDVGVYDELLSLALVVDGEVQAVTPDGKYAGLRAGESVVAFDRKTGRGVPDFEGDTWNTTGQTVKFPFDTQKKTYEYYDQTSRQAWPVEFVRETSVKGLDVYEFFGTVPETRLGQYGLLEKTDTVYSNTGRTVLVEPVTGSIVSSTTSPQTSIEFADGSIKPALLVDELVPTEATVADRVADAKDKKSGVLVLQRAPWGLGALGVLLLAAGAALLLRGRRRAETAPAGEAPVDLRERPDVSGLLPPARDEAPVRSRLRR